MAIIALLQKHKKRRIGLGLLAIDGLFYSFTNPHSVSSPLLIGGLLLLSVNFFAATLLLLRLSQNIGFEIGPAYRKAAYGATTVMALLVALQSVGQLTTRDVVVMVPFAVIAYVYVAYAQQEPQA